jgi:DNA-binding Lrp family transcriptional regulator
MKLNILAGDISPLVFQLSVKNEPGELSLDKEMLAIIRELDGKKPIGTVAKNTGLGLDKVREIIAKLLTQGIVALVNQSMAMMKEDFFIYLADQLSKATGPMAEVLIDEAVASLDCSQSNFPRHRVQELIDLLAPKIFREEKRAVFKENLYKKILNKEV